MSVSSKAVILSHIPRHSLLLPSIVSSLHLLLPAYVLLATGSGKVQLADAVLVLLSVYIATLPIIAAGVYTIVNFVEKFAAGGDEERKMLMVALLGILPGCFTVPLSALLHGLIRKGIVSGRARPAIVDALLNYATIGLHSVTLASVLERVVEYEIEREQDAAKAKL
jgi:hypothetical protein